MPVVTVRPDHLIEDIIGAKVARFRGALADKPDDHRLHSGLIANLDMLRSTSLEEAQAERKRWHARHRLPRFTDWPRADTDRLRIGYVGCDFRRTSAVYAFGPVVMDHDRSKFEVYCYAIKDNPDDQMRQIVAHNVEHFKPVEDQDHLVRLVREGRIDILVDLMGHIGGNMLPAFTRKLAPVQVSAWGCLGGTGCPEMDYLLSDPVVAPQEDRRHYTETIVDLPCALAYMPVPNCPDIGPPPFLRNGYVTFGFLGRLYKADDRTFQLWAEVLRQEPTAKLLLKSKRSDDDLIRRGVLHRFSELGVDPSRIDMRGQSFHRAHLETHNEVDLILDSLPQNGGISALEAMWMGCPVVTLPAQGPHGRVGASILRNLGLVYPTTEREFVVTALTYAREPELLKQLRAGLRTMIRRSWLSWPVKAVEEAYEGMWQRHQRGMRD